MPRPFTDSDIAQIAEGAGDLAPEFSGKAVLITGGCGFLGRYFVEALARLNRSAAKPCRMTVLDNFITSGPGAKNLRPPPHGRFVRHDIIKPYKPKEKPDYILHLAGIASPFYYRAYPLETLEAATIGAKNMLALARVSGARMLYFSSSEIYGDPDPRHVPTPESYRGNVTPLGPRACYDESKRLGETLCWIYHEKYGTSASIVRPFNVYGPGMQEADYRVLPNFASRLKAGKPVNIYGTGRQTRTFCYVTDAVAGFLRALVKGVPGEAYNIGNPVPEVSMLELLALAEKALRRKIPHRLIEYPDSYPADEPQRRCPDIKKARLQLGYEPKVPLEEGLRRFFAWAGSAYTGAPSK